MSCRTDYPAGRTGSPAGEPLPTVTTVAREGTVGVGGTGPEVSPEVPRSQANQPADQANRPRREPDATGTSWGFLVGAQFNEDVTFWDEFLRARKHLYGGSYE